ncbi:MAG: hypothetical protein ACXABD_22295 [Candidatus Thorarchaeota archaeon]|jgi:hypothetical protein
MDKSHWLSKTQKENLRLEAEIVKMQIIIDRLTWERDQARARVKRLKADAIRISYGGSKQCGWCLM